MIVVKNLIKRYGDRIAVNDVSFRVEAGEVIGFLGPNGAGKSTTMRMLTGFLSPTAGSVEIGGHDMATDTLAAKAMLGYLPELPPVYPEMTVRDYLDFVAKLKGLDRKVRQERLDFVLKKCFLSDRANQLIGQLSKGYRQRVGIAQALIHNPPVLILDEPTSGLDPGQIIEVRALIKELSVDHTIILSTHILQEVQNSCSRVLIINQGRVVAEGKPEELEERLQGGERLSVTVRGPLGEIKARLMELPGVFDLSVSSHPDRSDLVAVELTSRGETDLREKVASLVIGAGWNLVEMKSINLSLEDIFLKLTSNAVEGGAVKEVHHV